MRPEKLAPVLDALDQPLTDEAWLRRTVSLGLEHPRLTRLLRAERASSGHAHCRQCRELISKGSWRLALQMFEEGRMQPIGTIHVQCAEGYFGTADILDRMQRLTGSLEPSDWAELEQLTQRAPSALQA
jgi:hypothetical protein